jgi:hypothetical protein
MTHEPLANYQAILNSSPTDPVSITPRLSIVLCKALGQHPDALVGGFVFLSEKVPIFSFKSYH